MHALKYVETLMVKSKNREKWQKSTLVFHVVQPPLRAPEAAGTQHATHAASTSVREATSSAGAHTSRGTEPRQQQQQLSRLAGRAIVRTRARTVEE